MGTTNNVTQLSILVADNAANLNSSFAEGQDAVFRSHVAGLVFRSEDTTIFSNGSTETNTLTMSSDNNVGIGTTSP